VATVKRSQARMPVAWVRRNVRHDASIRRGAGSRPAVCKMRHTVAGPVRYPRPASSPCIRLWPQPGFSSEAKHQLPDFPADRWPARFGPWVGPAAGDQLPVPAQECARGHEERAPAGAGEQPGTGGEEPPVGRLQRRAGDLAAQHGDLMP
jgi:hypothetical protein